MDLKAVVPENEDTVIDVTLYPPFAKVQSVRPGMYCMCAGSYPLVIDVHQALQQPMQAFGSMMKFSHLEPQRLGIIEIYKQWQTLWPTTLAKRFAY